MEPRIQYAKTADGVNIAYSVMGEGPPLVRAPTPGITHAQRDWEMWGYIWTPLTRSFRVVIYDSRGTGLSDRGSVDFSMGAMVRDFDAVVEKAGLDVFPLVGLFGGAQIAMACAAAHPRRVSHLILADGGAMTSAATPEAAVASAVLEKDWMLFTETMARVLAGVEDAEWARAFSAHMRAAASPEAYRAALDAEQEWNVEDVISRVQAPTLVVQNERSTFVPPAAGQHLAASIPGARLVMIDDLALLGLHGLIEDFVLEGADRDAGAVPAPSGLVTILFTDIEGSTAMTQRLGDAKARDVLREHERVTRECLRAHGGSEVKTMGDGFMASFGSAVKALECAIAIQQAFDDRNNAVGAPLGGVGGAGGAAPGAGAGAGAHGQPIRVRIGLNAGEPIAEDDPDGRGDLFGTAVIRAARIAALASGGEILAANVVRELAEGKGFLFGDRGEVPLRGFDDPVRLFEVRWREGDA